MTAPRAEARRLTGPNLFAAEPGAALDVTWTGPPLPADAALDALAARWEAAVRALATAAGWPDPACVARRAGNAAARVLTLFVSAPFDGLDAAVDAAERAWDAAAADRPVGDEEAGAVREAARAARNPRLPALLDAAERHGLTATWDDDAVSVGVGRGSRTWAANARPAPDAIDWAALADGPVALITGSNGKTTTARLLAAMLRAAGHTVGTTSTDGVRVESADGEGATLEQGDWAGPGGARRALRDPRVTAAVLETARGGMLRRGLAVRRAGAAAVTNVAEDHFGDYGVFDLEALADVKLIVARALVATGGPLVLPAGDPLLRARGLAMHGGPFPVVWVAPDPDDTTARAVVDAHVAAGGRACAVHPAPGGPVLRWHDGAAWRDLIPVADVALAAGGAARHNVANAATAAPLALALGVLPDAVGRALRTFGRAADDNPGRLEVLRAGDVTVVVDYAHNPAGLVALLDAARALGGARRLLLLGQAGDRDDAAVGDLARAAWRHGSVDRVQLKEIPAMQRGRAPGEIPRLLRAALADAGAPPAAVSDDVAPTEPEAVRRALAWARPGDVVVLPLHVDRGAVVGWLRALNASGWRAGAPVPPPA